MTDSEFEIDNLVIKATERFSFRMAGWRGVFGSFPTSVAMVIDDVISIDVAVAPQSDLWETIDEFKGEDDG